MQYLAYVFSKKMMNILAFSISDFAEINTINILTENVLKLMPKKK